MKDEEHLFLSKTDLEYLCKIIAQDWFFSPRITADFPRTYKENLWKMLQKYHDSIFTKALRENQT